MAKAWVKWCGVLGLGAVLLTTGTIGPQGRALAADASAADDSSTQAADAPAMELKGFRTAEFGMTEAEVRSAISHDFGLHGSAVHGTTDAIQQTHALQVTVPDLIPKGGNAQVTYVFGYQSKRLFHIQLAWSRQKDASVTQQQIVTDSQLLANFFGSAGYQPKSIGTNMIASDGVILFRGTDAADHATVMILHGAFAMTKDKQKVFVPTALTVDYISHPKQPDVFQLPSGKF
jgi:hypothetical protein